MKIAPAAVGAAALAWTAAAAAQSASYPGPGYSYARPPYSYQPPPYSYQSPSYGYEPPGYLYTPPGMYRRGYRLNTPDYNQAYQYPPSVYGDPRQTEAEAQRRSNLHSPYYNQLGNPRHPADPAVPPYDSPAR